ncbi:hypothetical protein SISNIDRAFT_460840, partial [Sistotremastrum niveocremeum HHB9708]
HPPSMGPQIRSKSSNVDNGTLLRGLKGIADSTSIPYAQAIAGLALLIYDASQKVQSHHEDVKRLAERVIEVAMTVASSISTAADTSEDLVRNVGILLRSLEQIENSLRTSSKKKKWSRFLRSTTTAASIAQCEDQFEQSIAIFLLQTQLNNVRLSDRMNDFEGSLCGELEFSMKEIRGKEALSMSNKLTCAPSPDRIPRSLLPPPPQVFHGRDAFIEQAIGQLSKSASAYCAIIGPGGIGKSSLALKIVHEPRIVNIFGDSRHFISCESVTDSETLISTLANHFDMKADAFVQDFVRVLDTSRTRALIVLDNFETPWEISSERSQVEEILAKLSVSPQLSIVVTMRGAERPLGIAWTRPFLPPLSLLDPDSAKEVFVSISDVPEDDPNLPDLLRLIDYVPLAIVLMANLAQFSSCANLIDLWNEQKTAFLSRGNPSRQSSLDISLQISLSSERLQTTPEAFEVLQMLSLLPDGVAMPELLSMAPSAFNLAPAVSALRRVALIYDDVNQRLRLLSPVREFVRTNFPIEIKTFSPILEYYFQLLRKAEWEHQTFTHSAELTNLIFHLGNMRTVIDHALQKRFRVVDVIKATVELADISSSIFPGPLTHRLISFAKKLAHDLDEYALEAECIIVSRLNLEIRESVKEDVRQSTEALELARRAKAPLTEAKCLLDLGVNQRRLGDYVGAENSLKNALAIFHDSGNLLGQARCLGNLGDVAFSVSKQAEALALASEGARIAEQHEFPLAAAKCCEVLAAVHKLRGAFPFVARYTQRALTLRTSVLSQAWYHGPTLNALGDLYFALGRISQAKEMYDKAYEVFTASAREDWIACVHISFGRIALLRGNIDESLTHFHLSLQEWDRLKYPGEAANCLAAISEAEIARNNLTTAWSHLQQSLRLYRINNEIGFRRNGTPLMRMGDICVQREDPGRALRFYITACLIHRNSSNRVGLAECIKKIGD